MQPYCVIPLLYEVPIVVKSRMVIAQGYGEERMGKLVFNGVSFGEDENCSGDGWWQWLHSNMNVLNAEMYT
jgi:hypothetical protein